MYTDAEIRSIGMAHLVKKLGKVDTERFISGFIKDSGNYTLARRELYDDLTLDEVFESASDYMREHPLCPETKARLDAYKKEHMEGRVFLRRTFRRRVRRHIRGPFDGGGRRVQVRAPLRSSEPLTIPQGSTLSETIDEGSDDVHAQCCPVVE